MKTILFLLFSLSLQAQVSLDYTGYRVISSSGVEEGIGSLISISGYHNITKNVVTDGRIVEEHWYIGGSIGKYTGTIKTDTWGKINYRANLWKINLGRSWELPHNNLFIWHLSFGELGRNYMVGTTLKLETDYFGILLNTSVTRFLNNRSGHLLLGAGISLKLDKWFRKNK